LRALSDASGRDVATPFRTFLDQPGVPLVSFEIRCAAKKIVLGQERYFPTGSGGSADEGLWQVPICVRRSRGNATQRECTLLVGREAELPLDGDCPAYLVPNDGGAGYFRSLVTGDGLTRLLADGGKRLSVAERVAVLGDLAALVRAGKVDAGDQLALVPSLAKDPSRHVIQNLVSMVTAVRDSRWISDSLRPAYTKLVRDSFGARARGLGWLPKKGDDEDTRILRNTIVPLVADHGEDPALIAEAKKLAAAWLRDRKAVDAEAVDGVLAVAAQNGDRAQFESWLQEARAEKDRLRRRRLLAALGAYRDPALVKQSLELLLDDTIEWRDMSGVLWAAQRWPGSQPIAWSFVREKFDALAARMPRDSEANLMWAATGLCDQTAARELTEFFAERAARLTKGPRTLAQAQESLQLCAALRARQSASAAKFLSARR
jgi:alanyl aminopeptidase